MKRSVLFFAIVLANVISAYAQEVNQPVQNKLRIYLNPDKTSYVGFKASTQIWARYTENNPGTLVDDKTEPTTFDLSLRRVRFCIDGELSPRLSFVLQMGNNNFNYLSNESKNIKLLEAYTTYKVAEYLTIGAGKSGWTGLARATTPGSSNALGVDIPMFSLPTLNVSDDILRKMSAFAYGTLFKVNYRFAVVKPFVVTSSSALELSPEGNSNFSGLNPKIQSSGYISYSFWDKENSTSAFYQGTYLGSKRILNVGGGFMHQPDAMAHLNEAGNVEYTDMKHFAADVFLEMPLCMGNCSALTVYGAYYNYNFGNGYIRNIGANNPGQGVNEMASFNGKGNAYPAIGTGDVMYLQVGYSLPEKRTLNRTSSRYQVYASVQHANYDRLASPMNLFEGGVNYYMDRYSKFTFGYQNRPIFNTVTGTELQEVGRKGMWVLQWQIKIF